MTSLNEMIRRIEGLQDTKDVSEWESNFCGSIARQTQSGKNTGHLSEKQIEIIERIHNKHFS